MKNSVRPFIGCIFFGIVCSFSFSASFAESTNKSLSDLQSNSSQTTAKSLVNAGRFDEAYRVMKQNEVRDSSESEDLLLGNTSLLIGKPDQAIMACERASIEDPNLPEAKICLADAYYKLGQYGKAEDYLLAVKLDKNKEYLKPKIDDLLNKARIKRSHRDKNFHLYGNLTYGFDNNAAATTDENYYNGMSSMVLGYDPITLVPYQVWNPILRRWMPNPFYDYQVSLVNDLANKVNNLNSKPKSEYLYPQIGINGKHIFGDFNSNIYWDVRTSHKEYLDVDGYNVTQVNGILGFNKSFKQHYLFNMAFYYDEFMFDGSRYRESPVVSLGLSRALGVHNVLKIYTEDGIFTYPNNRELSIYMYVGGLEWMCFNNKTTFSLRGYYGRNQPKGGGEKYNGSNYYGSRASLRYEFIKNFIAAVDFTAQHTLHDVKDPKYTDSERERAFYYQVGAGLNYRLAPGYVWYVQGVYNNNHSNVFAYKYDRLEVFTGLSFEL